MLLAEQDRRNTRLEGMRRSLELTDGVICKRSSISVRFAKGNQKYPAWCSSGHITIAVDMIPDLMSVRGMGTLIGLNYHEVAHTLYSPESLDDLLVSEAKSTNFGDAYRILEENRVETLMIGRYSAVRKNFLLPVLTFLKRSNSGFDRELFLLTHGRRYIPRQIRKSYRELFEKEYGAGVTTECADIIDQYRFVTLTTSVDYLTAGDLVNRLAEIMQANDITVPSPDEDAVSGTPTRGAARANEKKPEPSHKDREKDAEKAKRQEEDDGAHSGAGSGFGEAGDDRKDDLEEQSGQSGAGDPQDGGGEDDGPDEPVSEDGGRGGQDLPGEAGRPQASGSGPQRSGEHQGGPDRTGDPAPSDGIGTEEDKSPKQQVPENIYDEIENEISKLLRDEEVLQKVMALRKASDDHIAQNSVLAENPARRKSWPVTSQMVRRSEALGQRLQELWAQIESGWNFGVSEGSRLDMNRIFSAQTDEDLENVYIDWEPGRQESSGSEWVIVADESESMSGYGSAVQGTGKKRYQIASEGVWGVRSALDRVEARCTVLTFQTDCHVLYHRDEETDPGNYHLFSSTGGTQPQTVIEEARRILATSDKPHKGLIVFTDGSWYSGNPVIEDSLDSMDGVVKVCALIRGNDNRPWSFDYASKFDVVEETKGDLLDIMARAVVHMMERTVQ